MSWRPYTERIRRSGDVVDCAIFGMTGTDQRLWREYDISDGFDITRDDLKELRNVIQTGEKKVVHHGKKQDRKYLVVRTEKGSFVLAADMKENGAGVLAIITGRLIIVGTFKDKRGGNAMSRVYDVCEFLKNRGF